MVAVKALGRIAFQALPDESGCYEHFDARCADALRRMASQSIGADSDPDRATVVIHVDAEVLAGGSGAGLVEDGPLLPTETARRLACDSRWQLFADFEGQTVGIGRISRRIPASLLRALRLRDRCCRFPGCERTRWLACASSGSLGQRWLNRSGESGLVVWRSSPFCSRRRMDHLGRPGWRGAVHHPSRPPVCPETPATRPTTHGPPRRCGHRKTRLVGPSPPTRRFLPRRRRWIRPALKPETEGADAQRATAESATSPRR